MVRKKLEANELTSTITREQAIEAVKTLLAYIGEDPDRQGLKKTPERVIKAWENDWGLGYDTSYVQGQIDSITGGRFDDGAESYDAMITVQNITFTSHCEHHMAPFSGTAAIGYIPKKKGPILGLSKLVRVVEMFSKRLQVQERLTTQIADFIQEYCKPIGVGVVLKSTHGCMITRGVKQFDTFATTSALRGEMYSKREVRDEFLRLVGQK